MIAKQVVESVMSLHRSGVVHRDIKPSNFLIDDAIVNTNLYVLKIIDFA
jgi:serine/threonine protein kinase